MGRIYPCIYIEDRKILYDNIPNIIQNSKNIYENKIQNQSSLFSDENQKISYLIKKKDQSSWPEEEILSKEFESLGFYISNHPLKNYEAILKQYKVKSFKDFEESKDIEAFIAGTIMSIKEKKTMKGNSFAIIKFSDLSKVYELFIFSELLESNRQDLVEGRSFILTIIRDKENQENRFRRISVRKIVNLSNVANKEYNNVYIEIDKSENLKELYETIKEKGNSKIKISINEKDKKYSFELKEGRKFDFEKLKSLNNEQYIKKIDV